MKVLVLSFLVQFALLVGAAHSQEPWRTALVIANEEYVHYGSLENPIRDGELIERSLKEAGFDRVLLKKNLTRGQINQTLAAFARESQDAGVALIYFAGHGIGTGEGNYLLPVEANLGGAADAGVVGVSADALLRATVGARVRMVVLDACRNFPLGGATDPRRGLVAQEIDDVVVMFSAADGAAASDGVRGGNSPFAAAFARALSRDGLDVRRFAGVVRESVMALTKGEQRPYFAANLGSEEYILVPPADDLSRYGDRLVRAVSSARIARDRARSAAASAEDQLAQAVAARPNWYGSERMMSEGRYRGEVASAIPNGLGELEFRDFARAGETYIGRFVDGEIEGLGVWTGRKPAVQGWLRYEYAGEHRSGRRHGDGVMSIAQPPGLAFDVYQGQVREDAPNGFGVMRFADGRRYDGEWRNGAPDGYGMARTTAGQWLIGRWSAGELVEDLRAGK
jgi:hypothetical protein